MNNEKSMITKKFEFGKIDYFGCGRKINKVDVDVRLYTHKDNSGHIVFSACGDIWNGRGTDIVCCGQCLDEIAKFIDDPIFKQIYGWWQAYRLNDMHLGTTEQEEYLEKNRTWSNDYSKDCDCLKKAGLYEVEVDGKLYKYGTNYLYQPIPENVLSEMIELIHN